MAGKLLTGAVVLGALALAAWAWRDTPAVRDATRQLQASSVGRWIGEQAKFPTPDVSGQRKRPATPEATAGAVLHKCAGDAGVTYTNGACPPGTRRLQVDGAVTVLPAVRPAPAKPDMAASGPVQGPLAELAGPPLKGSLKDKHMDGMR
jgi:hypothetical protein